MNEFKLCGQVARIEERQTRKGGTFHVVHVEDSGGEVIPVPFFSRHVPAVGEAVEISGKLGSRNGFLCLIPDRRESEGEPPRRWKKPPEGMEPRREKVMKPSTEHFINDDLPF